MHELSLVEALLDQLTSTAQAEDLQRITALTVSVGTLSHVSTEALRFCFEACQRGTVAESAVLTIESETGHARCPACQREAPAQDWLDCCPYCGQAGRQIIRGRDVRLKSIQGLH
ncbi:MAG: hydrogenase maturation nickel metallochaperone HypA [Hahellaceae bacterium]|jgi:hydrogenase nickel incorporation protein HypA/HybF|nr:hydrogenase maturation nickel metallochaperone HypA [Hahellaceae bacterium]